MGGIHQFWAIAHINSDMRLVAWAQTVKSSASMQSIVLLKLGSLTAILWSQKILQIFWVFTTIKKEIYP